MNKYFKFDELGGFPLNQNRLEYMQQAYSESIGALSALVGDMVIVSGCIVNGNNVTDGWVIVNGQLLPFVGGANTLQSTFLVRTLTTPLTFWDGAQKEVQISKFCTFGIGGDAIEWASLTRLKTIKELNATTQTLTQQIMTGTFKDVFIDRLDDGIDHDVFFFLEKEIPDFDCKEWFGIMEDPRGAVDGPPITWHFAKTSIVGVMRFTLICPVGSFFAGDLDYVLIKKQ